MCNAWFFLLCRRKENEYAKAGLKIQQNRQSNPNEKILFQGVSKRLFV